MRPRPSALALPSLSTCGSRRCLAALAARRVVVGVSPPRVSTTRPPRRPPPPPTPPRRSFSDSPRLRNEPKQRRDADESSPPQPADSPDFTSVLDRSPELVRSGRRHGPGLILLALIPLTALGLGTWQVYRLERKTSLIAAAEDRITRPPLALPGRVDAEAVRDFDYRRVTARGRFRHDQEMLVGPRLREGQVGYMVVTPLERGEEGEGGGRGGGKLLVNRGWIAKGMGRQEARGRRRGGPGKDGQAVASRGEGTDGDAAKAEALPTGEVLVEGMLRQPWKKNMFTPDNRPERGEFYFPDVAQMAALTGSQPVWIEATMEPDWLRASEMEATGVPIGRPAEVTLRNNHAQYIFTWYGLAAATSVMLWMIVRKPPTDIARRVRQSSKW